MQDDLLATIEALCAWERGSASEGERRAAAWIADALRERGCFDVAVDEERGRAAGFAPQCSALDACGVLAGVLGLAGRRRAAAAVGAFAFLGLVDEACNGPRLLRRAVRRPVTVWNVVGKTGERGARDVLVLLAHHDAAQTGAVFDPTLQQKFAERFPGLVERLDTAIPLWWGPMFGPLLAGLAAGPRWRALGVVLSGLAAAAYADIARSPVVPGASDNVSAVAAHIELASRLRDLRGLEVWLVSCGSEEALQEGVRAFAPRHLAGRDRSRTWVLNLETLGGPRLSMLEGEGPLWMQDYTDPSFRDRVAQVAERAGIMLRRGLRARSSTDSVITSRMGFPTTTLVSIDRNKALAHYHLPSDTPEHVDLATVERATLLADAVARDLAGELRQRV